MNARKSLRIASDADRDLAREILDYLAERPAAADTLRGIAEWWLLRQRVRSVVAQVDRVLQRLTEEGFLETAGAGPDRRYRLHAGEPRSTP